MSKSIGIFYFSGTRNTEVVVKLLQKEFEMDQAHVTLIKMEDILKQRLSVDVNQYDLVGIGYPIYASNAPRIVSDFISALPVVNQKNCFIVRSSGRADHYATHIIRNALVQRGYTVFHESLFIMGANSFSHYPDELMRELYNIAVQQTRRVAHEILTGQSRLEKNDWRSRFKMHLAGMQEAMLRRQIKLSATIACKQCGKCVRNCPTGNIFKGIDTAQFGNDCLLCLRCVYGCPAHAIVDNGGRLALSGGYNLQKIIDNPTLTGRYLTPNSKGEYGRIYKFIHAQDSQE